MCAKTIQSHPKNQILTLIVLALFFLCFSVKADHTSAQEESPAIVGDIAFISDRADGEQIYLMDADGENERRLTDFENANLSDLDWSPDGNFIAYVNTIGANSDIYVLNVERLTSRRLTTHTGSDYNPAWSPDGSKIAYTTTRDGPPDVWVMTTRGANIRNITNDSRWEIAVGWTPRGSLAFVPNSGANLQIWTGDEDTPILFERSDDIVLHSITDFRWSPDSEYLTLQTDFGAYIVNIGGTNLVQIADRDNYMYGCAPSWSPDGQQIVFASNRIENPEIYLVDADGDNAHRLTDTPSSNFCPVWRPYASN
jgi:Tol biopolymer transport system component